MVKLTRYESILVDEIVHNYGKILLSGFKENSIFDVDYELIDILMKQLNNIGITYDYSDRISKENYRFFRLSVIKNNQLLFCEYINLSTLVKYNLSISDPFCKKYNWK